MVLEPVGLHIQMSTLNVPDCCLIVAQVSRCPYRQRKLGLHSQLLEGDQGQLEMERTLSSPT